VAASLGLSGVAVWGLGHTCTGSGDHGNSAGVGSGRRLRIGAVVIGWGSGGRWGRGAGAGTPVPRLAWPPAVGGAAGTAAGQPRGPRPSRESRGIGPGCRRWPGWCQVNVALW